MNKTTQFSQISEVLAKRAADTVGKSFSYGDQLLQQSTVLFLQSSSDIGVIRNGGRRGAKFAPQAILAPLSKMAAHELENKKISICTVSDEEEERKDFTHAQEMEARKIAQYLEQFTSGTVLHLGGGHDHVFPLLASLYHPGKKIKVLNIDAHMDTRIDLHAHSGTPFRQFEKIAGEDFELIQLGLHPFANTPSTQTAFEKGKMHCIDFSQLQKDSWNFTRSIQEILEYHFAPSSLNNAKKEVWVLSLDCDALEAGIMEGVSAVNHQGIPLHTVAEIFHYFKMHAPRFIAGLYEYNPIYDNLSQKGARSLAGLLYPALQAR